MKRIIKNMTAHPIVLFHDDGTTEALKSSGCARCVQTSELVDVINGVPVREMHYGEVVGLPEPEEGVVYLVSNIVAHAVKGREDVYTLTDMVRENNKVVGCRALSRVAD